MLKLSLAHLKHIVTGCEIALIFVYAKNYFHIDLLHYLTSPPCFVILFCVKFCLSTDSLQKKTELREKPSFDLTYDYMFFW